jgi:hypothetical protein
MAEHTAAIDRVHLNRIRDSGKPEGWTGKKIADNRLQVAAAEAAARLKGRETRRQPGGWSVSRCISMNY